MDYKAAVFIGRFQPFHNSHLEVLKHGLQIAERVLVIIGSYHTTLTPKNPFSFNERKEMILANFHDDDLEDRIAVEPIRDFYEQDSYWVAEIQNIVSKYTEDGDSIALLGSYKDSSSYYINYFRNIWDFIPSKNELMDATDIRDLLFEKNDKWESMVPTGTKKVIKQYINSTDELGYKYQTTQKERIVEYINEWGRGPHVTADCVVIQGGHVLVIKRKGKIGTGLLALPGGHVKLTERIEDAALRELKEETNIKLDKDILRGCIVAKKEFDYPNRSLLGRVITTAFVIRLQDRKLVEVKGGDDASHAFWMSFNDINQNEDLFFDDHIHIIRWAWTSTR